MSISGLVTILVIQSGATLFGYRITIFVNKIILKLSSLSTNLLFYHL